MRKAAQRRPLIPGGEGVGEVIEVGADVTRVRVGDRVNPLFVQRWFDGRPHPEVVAKSTLGGPLVDGTFAEAMLVPESGVVKVPDHLSDVEAATLPFAGLTAWSAVVEQALHGRRHGDDPGHRRRRVVRAAVLQDARRDASSSARRATTSSSARARSAPTTSSTTRRVPEWSQQVLEITDGCGADLVLDPGGTVTMAQSIRAVRPGGMISVYNALGSAEIGVLLPYLLGHNVRVQGTQRRVARRARGDGRRHRSPRAAPGDREDRVARRRDRRARRDAEERAVRQGLPADSESRWTSTTPSKKPRSAKRRARGCSDTRSRASPATRWS